MRLPERPQRGSATADQAESGTMPPGLMDTMPETPAEAIEGLTGGMPTGAMNTIQGLTEGMPTGAMTTMPGEPGEMPSGAMLTEMAADDMRPLELSEYGIPGLSTSAGMPSGAMTGGEKTLEAQNFEIAGKFRLTLFPGSLNVR